VNRLCLALAALLLIAAPAAAQRTSVGRDFPVYNNAGRPDLTVDPQRFVAQMEIVDRLFDPMRDACAFEEGVIGAAGYRRLLRFDTVIMNAGDGDLVIGERAVRATSTLSSLSSHRATATTTSGIVPCTSCCGWMERSPRKGTSRGSA
jgi:hypothetical protein